MKKSYLLIILFLGLFLSILDRGGLLNPLRNVFQTITLPIQIGVQRTVTGIKDQFSILGEIGSLRQKNRLLEEDNVSKTAEIAKLKKVEEENNLLREQLGVKGKINSKLTLANIIGHSPLETQSRLILDKGENYQIKVNDLVVYKNNFLGRIILVTPKTSTLQLLTDPESKIPVQSVLGTKGLLVGQFGSEIRLTKILQQEKVSEGDLILTLTDQNLPKDLTVGKVTKVIKEDKEIFQEAKVESLVSISKITEVFIMSN